MKTSNTFKSLSMLSLSVLAMLFFTACDPGPSRGPKAGDEGDEPEAYGLQEEDLPGGDDSKSATSQTGENAYPEDKLMENTNLEDDKPLELNGPLGIQQKMLMASLNGQRTDLEYQIKALQKTPDASAASGTLSANVDQLQLYLEKLDKEIVKVRSAEKENFGEISESAQETIKGAGDLIASRDMRITQGF